MKHSLLMLATLMGAFAFLFQAHGAQQEEALILEDSFGTGQAAPDQRITGHRLFPHQSGNGFAFSHIFTGSIFTGPGQSYVTAVDASGQRAWSRAYFNPMRSTEERANSVIELRNGDFAIGTGQNLAVERLNAHGELLWREEAYPSSTTGGYLFNADQILELNDGSLALIGSKLAWNSTYTNVAQDVAFARVSANGRLLWRRLAGGAGVELGRAVVDLPDQSLLFGAISHSSAGGDKTTPHYGQGDIWLAKHSYTGERLWDMTLGGPGAEELVSIQTNAQGIVVFAISSPPLGYPSSWVVQLDLAGNIIKDVTHGTGHGDYLQRVFPLPDGGWLLNSFHSLPLRPPSGVLIALNSDLSERWRREIQHVWATVTSSGDILAFETFPGGFGHLRLSPEGQVLGGQPTPRATPPYIASMGHLVETFDGKFLSTDFYLVNRWRLQAQERGAPFSWTTTDPRGHITVRLFTTFTNGVIHYTTNQSSPTLQSPRYEGPFITQGSMTVRAIAYTSDLSASVGSQIGIVTPRPTETITALPNDFGTLRLEGFAWNGPDEVPVINTISNVSTATTALVSNSVAHLTAIPNPGAEFIRWQGATNSTNPNIAILMDSRKRLEAVFGFRLQIPPDQGGSVLVDGLPSKVIVPPSAVTLQAVPNDRFRFAGWSMGVAGSSNPVVVTVASPTNSIAALFTPLAANEAAPTAIVLGPGSVSVTPRKNVYAVGEQITLRAEPAPGAMFIGWAGATNTASPELTITATDSERFTALFAGPTQDGFVTALPASPGATVLTSTNLIDWTPAQNSGTTHGANIIIDPAPLSRARYYRSTSAN